MKLAGDAAESILDTVQDSAYDEDTVIGLFNQCAKGVSRRLVLPSLDTEGTVTTVTNGPSVALPANFQRNLYYCKDQSISTHTIEICNSKDQLARYYDDKLIKTGTRVRGVAAVRPQLYYAPIPTVATTLTLRYQKLPDAINAATNLDAITPDGFSDLWENYALWKLYEKIEQGMEGQKVDTTYYMNLYLGLFDELSTSLKEGVSMPAPPVARMERW